MSTHKGLPTFSLSILHESILALLTTASTLFRVRSLNWVSVGLGSLRELCQNVISSATKMLRRCSRSYCRTNGKSQSQQQLEAAMGSQPALIGINIDGRPTSLSVRHRAMDMSALTRTPSIPIGVIKV